MEEALPYRKTGPEAVLRPTVSDTRVFRPRLPGMLVPGEGAPHSDPQSREHHQDSAVNWPHLPRLSALSLDSLPRLLRVGWGPHRTALLR